MAIVPLPVNAEVARMRVGRPAPSDVGLAVPVALRRSSFQAPAASTAMSVASTNPAAEPSTYVRVIVWFGTLLEPTIVQRFWRLTKSALLIATMSAAITLTVTVAGAESAPAASCAVYVKVYVPSTEAVKVMRPPAPPVTVAVPGPTGADRLTAATMSAGPSASVSWRRTFGSAVATPTFAVSGPSLTATGASFTAVMVTATLATFDTVVPTAIW